MQSTTLPTEEFEVSSPGGGEKAKGSVLENIYPIQNGELFNAFLNIVASQKRSQSENK
jgi:hypothetical protein